MRHNIDYGSLKKPGLTELFNKEIKPNSEEWHEEIVYAEPSTEGIEDVVASRTERMVPSGDGILAALRKSNIPSRGKVPKNKRPKG